MTYSFFYESATGSLCLLFKKGTRPSDLRVRIGFTDAARRRRFHPKRSYLCILTSYCN